MQSISILEKVVLCVEKCNWNNPTDSISLSEDVIIPLSFDEAKFIVNALWRSSDNSNSEVEHFLRVFGFVQIISAKVM